MFLDVIKILFLTCLLIRAVIKVAKTERLQSLQKHWMLLHFAELNFLTRKDDIFGELCQTYNQRFLDSLRSQGISSSQFSSFPIPSHLKILGSLWFLWVPLVSMVPLGSYGFLGSLGFLRIFQSFLRFLMALYGSLKCPRVSQGQLGFLIPLQGSLEIFVFPYTVLGFFIVPKVP